LQKSNAQSETLSSIASIKKNKREGKRMTNTTEVQKFIATRTAIRHEILVNPGNRYIEYVSASGAMMRMPNVIREFDPSWEGSVANFSK
jgi:hypothetical protein